MPTPPTHQKVVNPSPRTAPASSSARARPHSCSSRRSARRRRGAHVYGEIAGYGNTADAFHISKPDDAGQVRAMQAALADARMSPGDIDYVNAHGTATLIGDVVETAALKRVFGSQARRVAISSTKALHGHLMGATGAVELVATLGALERQVIPPTAHLEDSRSRVRPRLRPERGAARTHRWRHVELVRFRRHECRSDCSPL